MQNSQLRKATRQKAKIRLGLSAVAGGGKTYSAILIAKGMTNDLSRVCIIDTENGSADLYAHLGDYNVLTLTAPFSPEKYVEAIKTCEKAGMEVIIIDSITHEWEGKGGCLELADQITQGSSSKNSYTAWGKVTPRHQAFIDAILQSPAHIITTVRRKQDYEMTKDSSGKTKVEKAGLKEVTRESYEYELTINLQLDHSHNATASKDRTGLFMGKPEFIPTEETGKLILDWCESGIEPAKVITPHTNGTLEFLDHDKEQEDFLTAWINEVNKCQDEGDLVRLFNGNKETVSADPRIKELFIKRKQEVRNGTTVK